MWLLYLIGLAGLNELTSIDNKLAKNKPQNDLQKDRFIKMNNGKGHQLVIDRNNIDINIRLNHMWCSFWKALLVFGLCLGFSSVIVFIMTLKGKLPLDPYTKLTEVAFRNLLICIFTIGALITFFLIRSGLRYMKKRNKVSLPDLGVWSLFLFVWGNIFYYTLVK